MNPGVTPHYRLPTHAVCLDLRADGPRGTDPPGRLPAAVRAALDEPQAGDERRFLVIDHADRLVGHQLLYEQLYSYGPAQVICLALGGTGAAQGDRTLRRPLTLRPPAAGVLWLLDVLGDPDVALRPLVELLAAPDVFDAVLGALAEVVHGVAVPAVRVLEHDLTDEARTRTWKQALDSLVGQEVLAAGTTGPGDGLPAELAVLLDESVPGGVGGHRWLVPAGRAAARRRACDDALRDAEAGYGEVRGVAGLLGAAGTRHTDLPGRLEHLARALEGYHGTIAGALSVVTGVRLTPEHRGRLLERGIELPELPEVSRAGVVPGLRDFTERLIEQRLPLRSAAARLAALSDRSAPAGSAARLARLDEVCDSAYLNHLARPLFFRAGGRRAVGAALAGAAAFVAGLWPGPGWVLGPATGLVAAVLAALMLRHRPNRTPDGRLDGGGGTGAAPRLFGGLLGGVAGAATGAALSLPAWAGAGAALLALVAVAAVAVRDWRRAVDDWWRKTDAAYALRIVTGMDRVLVETAVHDWLFADARRHCSDGARAVSLLLRAMASTAEAYGDGGGDREGDGDGRTTTARETPAPRGPRHDPLREPWPEPWQDPRPEPRREAESPAWSWDGWSDSASDDGWLDAVRSTATDPVPTATDPVARSTDPMAPSTDPMATAAASPTAASPTAAPSTASESTARPLPESSAEEPIPDGPPGHGYDKEPADPPWLERQRGDGGPALVDTLVADLAAGAGRILARCWAGVERDPVSAGRTPLDGPVRDLLDEARTRLLRDAAASPPPYDPRPELRPDAARLIGVTPDRVVALLTRGGDTDRPLPLCGPQHRRLLSGDPAAVRQVRFVPESVRRGAERDEHRDGRAVTGEDVVWTPVGRHAGVLRLVPLRADIVRTVRAEAEAEEHGAP
ncbi:hypothetical protein [Streptomyces sp. NPDC006368]|uniref:hypothetical protein n=1 Tax=Streptomyces sp. NPDC006368 TaxID=3156760 RepID=UPI0033A4E645